MNDDDFTFFFLKKFLCPSMSICYFLASLSAVSFYYTQYVHRHILRLPLTPIHDDYLLIFNRSEKMCNLLCLLIDQWQFCFFFWHQANSN